MQVTASVLPGHSGRVTILPQGLKWEAGLEDSFYMLGVLYSQGLVQAFLTQLVLYQGFICSPSNFGHVLGHFWSSQLGQVLLVSRGQRPGVLLKILQCMWQLPQQGIICSWMSIERRLKNPGLIQDGRGFFRKMDHSCVPKSRPWKEDKSTSFCLLQRWQ